MPEQSLGRLLAVLRARWRLMVLVAVVPLLLSIWYAESRPPAYSSQVVLSLLPEPTATPNNSFLRLVPRYLVTATAPEALRVAEARAGLPAGALDDSVTAVNPTSTVEMTLAVTTESATASPVAVGVLADAVLRAADADPLVSARIIVEPTEPTDRTPLRRLVVLTAGVMVAVASAMGLTFLLEGARPRVRVREDLVRLGIPVVVGARRRNLRARRGLVTGHVRSVLRQLGEPLLVTSPGTAEADEVRSVAALLEVPRPVAVPDRSSDQGAVKRGLAAHPGLRTEKSARVAVVDQGNCVVVVRAGTHLDEVEDCLRLVDRLGGRLVGGVLVG